MKFTSITVAMGLASSALASPVNRRGYGCLSHSFAETIVSEYASILSHTNSDLGTPNATAQAILSDNYEEISDSILSLEGLPLGGVTFAGKQLYIASTLGGPPVMGINTIEVLVAGCDKVLWYWNFLGIGSAVYEIRGFNLFTITTEGQIGKANLEFNSFAWALDTGYNITFPTIPPTTK
jgi:hypothetical protein